MSGQSRQDSGFKAKTYPKPWWTIEDYKAAREKEVLRADDAEARVLLAERRLADLDAELAAKQAAVEETQQLLDEGRKLLKRSVYVDQEYIKTELSELTPNRKSQRTKKIRDAIIRLCGVFKVDLSTVAYIIKGRRSGRKIPKDKQCGERAIEEGLLFQYERKLSVIDNKAVSFQIVSAYSRDIPGEANCLKLCRKRINNQLDVDLPVQVDPDTGSATTDPRTVVKFVLSQFNLQWGETRSKPSLHS